METEKEIVVSSTPADLIQTAILGGADLEKLEKLLTLQERWEANEARKAYHRAMAEFKKTPPIIEKDKKIAYKEVKYSHASLANVTEKINQELSKHGLSASWNVKQNGIISVTCKITHEKGHSEETTLSAPSDTTGSKNAIQSIGSTVTYLERYSILALTGLSTFDMDDDANSVKKFIGEEELKTIKENLELKKTDLVKFLKYLKIEKLEDMQKSDFKKAMNVLENVKTPEVKK